MEIAKTLGWLLQDMRRASGVRTSQKFLIDTTSAALVVTQRTLTINSIVYIRHVQVATDSLLLHP